MIRSAIEWAFLVVEMFGFLKILGNKVSINSLRMTGDDLNVVHSKHKSDYKNILTGLVYEKDDFESRFKELLDHAAIT
jgi:hypothetical protein